MNPLGHHGNSEGYCTPISSNGPLYDHKYKVAYNRITYLLCEADKRRDDSPGGRLDDVEVLAAWVHAKDQGYIPADNSIPHRALRSVAISEGLCTSDEIEQTTHRNRPILSSESDERHIYLLTSVATGLPIDRLTGFDAFLNPTEHHLDVRDSALKLLDAMTDGEDSNEDYAADGGVISIGATVTEWHEVAQGAGMDVLKSTISRALGAVRASKHPLRTTNRWDPDRLILFGTILSDVV